LQRIAGNRLKMFKRQGECQRPHIEVEVIQHGSKYCLLFRRNVAWEGEFKGGVAGRGFWEVVCHKKGRLLSSGKAWGKAPVCKSGGGAKSIREVFALKSARGGRQYAKPRKNAKKGTIERMKAWSAA